MSIFSATLLSGSNKMGIEITKERAEKFEAFYNLLIEANKVTNLTGITDPVAAAYLHILDAVSPMAMDEISGKVIDVGSGAGLPGIPIAIFRPDINIIMMDSRGKCTDFICRAILELGLSNAQVICVRAEELGRDPLHREMYDTAIARALAPLNILTEYLFPFVKVGGKVVAYKGSSIDCEVRQAKTALRALGGGLNTIKAYENPHEFRRMSIFSCDKIKQTNGKYPRKTGIPTKFPIK